MARMRTLLAVGLAALLGGCGDTANLERRAGRRPGARICPSRPARSSPPSTSPRRSAGRRARRRPRPRACRSTPSPPASIIRAGSTPCPTATCWSPNPPRRRSRKGRAAAASAASSCGLFMREAGSASAERQPHHPAARRRWRRRRRDRARLYHRPHLADRHGPGRLHALRRQCRRAGRLSLRSRARPGSPPRPRRIAALPAGRNHHWTKTLAANADGSRLYVGVGSNSNVAEHGMAEEEGRAAIWEFDPASGQGRDLRLRPAQPGRHRLPARHERAFHRRQRARRARQRPRPRLSDQGAARRPSTAGRGAIGAIMSTRASSRPIRTWSPARSGPIMRSATMSRRSA